MKEPINQCPPLNPVVTPLEGEPDYRKTGIIKAVIDGEKVAIAKIIYEHFWNEEYQYIIEPFWDTIDRLDEEQPYAYPGIPGINMDCRYEKYYRVNRMPFFVEQRVPPRNRVDLMALMSEVGLSYYDPFEWLLRTDKKASQDNLIVEKE